MILADKIVRLRKKNGWSQEELAQKMNVSRQAVSKWESAQTIPELEKILQLGALFGVTTDYLLKDDMELEEFTSETIDSGVRQISIEEAGTYLVQSRESAKRIAVGTFLCDFAAVHLQDVINGNFAWLRFHQPCIVLKTCHNLSTSIY